MGVAEFGAMLIERQDGAIASRNHNPNIVLRNNTLNLAEPSRWVVGIARQKVCC